jgi:DNA-binding NtrC family response regulator
MNKKNILVVSNPGTMNDELLEWINTANFGITFADDDERAIELSHQQLFDMVIIDRMDAAINEKKLKAIMPVFNPEVLFVVYNGEAAVQLETKVSRAFDKRKAKRLLRLLVLDSSAGNEYNTLPPFSLN